MAAKISYTKIGMKLNYLYIALFLGASISFGCKHYCDDMPVSQVTFVDKGGVYPGFVTTKVIISPDSIEHIIVSENGTIDEQWSQQIQSSDFDVLQQIIDEHDLFCADDITLRKWQSACTGWQGMTITIRATDNSSHAIDIEGAICIKEQWPAGVRELVELEDALVEKYQ